MIHELRTYRCLPGRLPALLQRFEHKTLALFERHGIRQAGFWTVLVGESHLDLVYLLEWPDMGERERRWSAFQADPEWQAARIASEADGLILANVSNVLLQPTAFSVVR